MAKASTLSDAIIDFGFDMHRKLVNAEPQNNLLHSPFSISVAMAMTLHGCRGNTQTQLATVMNTSQLEIEDVNSAFSELLASLLDPKANKCTLVSANRLYVKAGRSFAKEFLKINKEVYQANVVEADFATKSKEVSEEINAWVASATRNKIQDLVSPDVLDPLTAAVLLNALYFKGDWDEKFDTSRTRPHPFHCMDGSEKEVLMMQQSGNFGLGYERTLGVQVLSLPYVGKSLQFVALAPRNAQDLPVLEEKLNAVTFKHALATVNTVNCMIGVPRFRLEFDCELSDTMRALGASDIYDKGRADLSGVDGTRELYMSKTLHKAFIEVNEEGSEAAAATANVMRMRCLPPSCFLDKPFLFVLYHTDSCTPLFVGRMINPPFE